MIHYQSYKGELVQMKRKIQKFMAGKTEVFIFPQKASSDTEEIEEILDSFDMFIAEFLRLCNPGGGDGIV